VDDTSIVLFSLHSFKVVHVKRDANETTNGLAKKVVTHVIDSIWLKYIPPIIYDIVCRKHSVSSYLVLAQLSFFNKKIIYLKKKIKKMILIKICPSIFMALISTRWCLLR
jgi:hypothetical protein